MRIKPTDITDVWIIVSFLLFLLLFVIIVDLFRCIKLAQKKIWTMSHEQKWTVGINIVWIS